MQMSNDNGHEQAIDVYALLEIDRSERARACGAEIQAALERYRCRLQAETIIAGERVQSRVVVVALDRQASVPAQAEAAPAPEPKP